jgi:hypothetical protein
MWYKDVDLHAPNGDKIDVEAFTMVHLVQIAEIDYKLQRYNGTEHPCWDRRGDRVNALLHGVHDPSIQLTQFRQPFAQLPPIPKWFSMLIPVGRLMRFRKVAVVSFSNG